MDRSPRRMWSAGDEKESKDIYFADDDYLIEKHTGSFTTTQAEQILRALRSSLICIRDTFPKDIALYC